jgi:DNA segregation ATPase FtsK/SpoIIIE, S-DNA-T family
MPDVEPWHIVGTALMAAALIGVLALTWPENQLMAPIAKFFNGWLGWLAGLGLLWICALGVLMVAPWARPRPWVWIRFAESGVVLLALLTLDAFEPVRHDGQIGRWLSARLTDNLGTGVSVAATVLTALIGTLAASGVRPLRVYWAVATLGGLLWRLVMAASEQFLEQRERLSDWWTRRQMAKAAVRNFTEPTAAAPQAKSARKAAPAEAVSALPPPEGTWKAPPLGILAPRRAAEPTNNALREQARIIEETLASFNIVARVAEINQGPAVTQYGIEPAQGVPVSRVTSRVNDLALRLGASPIRIEAPVPGKRMIGIEVPNNNVSVVGLREILESDVFARSKASIPLALGRDIAGKAVVADIGRMPHLLIAGATGSGKSVAINALVACLLSQFTPDKLQFVMVDPKMVELIAYNGIPHLRMPVVTEMDRIVGTLKWVAQEMERRYKLFAANTQRNIEGYNQLAKKIGERPLPYLVVIIDELADLMMTAPEEAEKTICRLAQLARATGIHLVVATQRPSVDVVTGLIKANFPSRMAFAVTSQIDSRVILDMVGAERLLGRGDMLYMPPDASKPMRVQGTYVSDEEIEALVTYWKELGTPQYDGVDLEEVETLGKPAEPGGDDLYDRAVELAQRTGKISVSLLQRRLGIGYPRAARLVDLLEERGIISTAEDGRAREVLVQAELPDD